MINIGAMMMILIVLVSAKWNHDDQDDQDDNADDKDDVDLLAETHPRLSKLFH